MADNFNAMLPALDKAMDQGRSMMERLLSAAHANSVFSQPITAGNHTVILASEVMAGGGFGSGQGGGSGPAPTPATLSTALDQPPATFGAGGGMGGAGGSSGRPVAAISIGPDGVTIKPILDPTKLALAALTTWAAVALTMARLSKASRAQ
jgi:uncharacterized spore protein YtfJ